MSAGKAHQQRVTDDPPEQPSHARKRGGGEALKALPDLQWINESAFNQDPLDRKVLRLLVAVADPQDGIAARRWGDCPDLIKRLMDSFGQQHDATETQTALNDLADAGSIRITGADIRILAPIDSGGTLVLPPSLPSISDLLRDHPPLPESSDRPNDDVVLATFEAWAEERLSAYRTSGLPRYVEPHLQDGLLNAAHDWYEKWTPTPSVEPVVEPVHVQAENSGHTALEDAEALLRSLPDVFARAKADIVRDQAALAVGETVVAALQNQANGMRNVWQKAQRLGSVLSRMQESCSSSQEANHV